MSNYRVVSADGTRLAVREQGNPDGPTVVCVHGYPDDSTLWDGVVSHLADHCRVITYDVRGAGQSDRPKATQAYRLERLAEDLRAVGVDERVHVLAHDWGSIQVWHALGNGLRAASFTSISGPELNRARAWMRANRRSRQTIMSTYILLFHVRGLADALAKLGVIGGFIKLVDPSHRRHPVSRLDALHGLKLYRANVFRAVPIGDTDVPAQIIAPTRDPFVGPDFQAVDGAPMYRPRAGHWLPLSDPRYVAERTRAFISEIMSRAD